MKTTSYLNTGNPTERKAFFDGFRAAMSVLASTNPAEYAHVLNHRSDEWITYLIAQLENQQISDHQATISHIIDRYGYDKAMFRAFMLGYESVNDDGIELKPGTITPVEDNCFRLLDGQAHHPYRNCILINCLDHSATIPYDVYTTLPQAERQNWAPDASWFDINHRGARIIRVRNIDDVYIQELLRRDIATGDPIIDRYICETGSACIHKNYLAPGRLHTYRDIVADAIADLTKDCPSCSPLYPVPLLHQIRNGDINSYGQFKLAQCLSLLTTNKISTVTQQISVLAQPLIDLLKFDGTEESLPDWLTKHDIIGYRDINRRPLYGAEPGQKDGDPYIPIDHSVASAGNLMYYLRVALVSRLAHYIQRALSISFSDNDMAEAETNTTSASKMVNQLQQSNNNGIIPQSLWDYMDELDELISLCADITGNYNTLPIQNTINKVRRLADPSSGDKNEATQSE